MDFINAAKLSSYETNLLNVLADLPINVVTENAEVYICAMKRVSQSVVNITLV